MPSKRSILFLKVFVKNSTFELSSSTGCSTGTEKVDEWGKFPFPFEELHFFIFAASNTGC